MKHFQKVLMTVLSITAILGGMFVNIYPGLAKAHADNRSEVMVEKGQDVDAIAREYHLDVHSLMQRNSLTSKQVEAKRSIDLKDVEGAKRPVAGRLKLKQSSSNNNIRLNANIAKLTEADQSLKKRIAVHSSTNSYYIDDVYDGGNNQPGYQLLRGDYSVGNPEKATNRYEIIGSGVG